MRGLVLLGWVVLLAFVFWPVLKWMLQRRTHAFGAGTRAPRPRALHDELVKDPVCQTYIVRSRAVTRSARGGMHYFCSPECAARFVGKARG